MNSRHHTFSSLVWTGLVCFCALFTDAVSSVWSLSAFFLRTTAVTDSSLQYDIGDEINTTYTLHVEVVTYTLISQTVLSQPFSFSPHLPEDL